MVRRKKGGKEGEGKREEKGKEGRKEEESREDEREEKGRGERGVADLHNFLCSYGPNDRLHGTGVSATLVGKPCHEPLIQLFNLRVNK